MHPTPGQNLGPYRIVERIGRGGMAAVYKAYQPSLDRYVAIKVLPAHLTDEPGFAERFRREARAVAKLEHPHILAVHDYGQEGDLTYIAMRYVEGGTLKDLLGKPLELPLVVDFIGQIAEALDYAHEHGVIHRDVKPSNVLLDRGSWTLLTDFGVARMVESTQQLTGTGVGVGTPAYMSPEQGQGKQVDRRSDVYSLGVVLYEMLTGRVPFEAETPLAVVWKHVNEPLPLPRSINPEIPDTVERVVLRAMAKERGQRFETAMALGEAIARADADSAPSPVGAAKIQGAPTRGTSIDVRRVPELGKRRPALLSLRLPALMAAAVLGIVAAALFGTGVLRLGEGTDSSLTSEIQGGQSAGDSVRAGKVLPEASVPDSVSTATALSQTEITQVDLTLYDDFSNSDFEGRFNPELWEAYPTSATIQQGNGHMTLGSPDGSIVDLNAGQRLIFLSPQFLEADLMLDGVFHNGVVRFSVGSDLPSGQTWGAECLINREGRSLCLHSFDEEWPGSYTTPYGRAVEFDSWHTFRMEFDPPKGLMSFFLDGQLIGSLIPEHIDLMKGSTFHFWVGVLGVAGGRVVGYADNVRTGPLDE